MALLAHTLDDLNPLDGIVLSRTPLTFEMVGVKPLASAWISIPLASAADRTLNPFEMVGAAGGGAGIEEQIPEQYIRGHVRDVDGYGIPRVVIAVDRATGIRLAITTSDADGDFVIRPRTLDPCILIAVPLDGEQLNAVVLDNILPVPD